jgi:hypothetical protein
VRRGAALALALGLATGACDRPPPIPEVDLLLRVGVDSADVESGKAFGLTVVRVWSRDWTPSEWNDRALSPLVVRLESSSRREEGGRVEETRRYRGYAFAREDVRVPAPSFRARRSDGGEERLVAAAPLRLRVRPALPPAAPAAPELPGEPIPEPGATWPWAVALGAVLLAALGLLVARARRRAGVPAVPPPEAPVVAPPSPAEVALERLSRVAARASPGPDERRDDVAEVAAVVRAYVAERFAVRAHEKTSPEVRAAIDPAVGAGPRVALATVLDAADWAKFAAAAPAPKDRLAVLADAASFVRETAPPSAAAVGAAS